VKLLRNDKFASVTPVITALLLEGANVGQLFQMWSERSALGQSVWSWVMVNLALWLWLNFYHVKCPQEKFAIWATRAGIFLNSMVVASVVYFRYCVGAG
jgi:uncharacterized membrane protein YbaN (DUF454 family)